MRIHILTDFPKLSTKKDRGSICTPATSRDAITRAATLAQPVAQAGCELLFLPAYSPDINPIEHFWALLKSRLRPQFASKKHKRSFIAKT